MRLLFVLALLLAGGSLRAQAPAAPADLIRVTIAPGHSVTIYAASDRVSMHNNKMGESVIEIDTAPTPKGYPVVVP